MADDASRGQRPYGGPADPDSDRRRSGWVAAGIALVVVLIVLVVWLLLRQGGTAGAGPSASPTVTPSHTPTVTVSVTPSETTATATTPGPCTAAQLDPSVASDGGAAGTVYYAILLRNTAGDPCSVSGKPALSGVTASGTTEALHLDTNLDGANAQQHPITGPGDVAPGERAGLLVSKISDPGNCPPGGSTYATLKIDLGGGQVLTMPYPADLAPAACLVGQSQVGLVGSP
jgi:hypothetical protein